MVADITKLVHEYEVRVRSLQSVPRFSYGRRMLGPDRGPTRLFFSNLFHDHVMAILIPRSPVTMSRLGFHESFFNTTFSSDHVEVRVL
jgi:hypothetical protein